MHRIIWTAMLAVPLLFCGCDRKPAEQAPGKVTEDGKITENKVTEDDVRRDAGQAVDTATEFARQSKDEFETKLADRLEQLDKEIDELRARGRDLQGEAKAEWDRKMADLETKREKARLKLEEVRRSSGEAWKDIRQGAQSAWEELDKSFRDASSEF